MFKKLILIIGVSILFLGCTNTLNERTYYRYSSIGAEAEKNGNVDVAEEAYSRALVNVKLGNLGSLHEAETLFNLGRMERLKGKFNLSLKHLKKSLEIDEKFNEVDKSIVIGSLAEIAKTYYEKKEYKNGIPYLDRIVSLNVGDYSSKQSERFIKNLFNDYSIELKNNGLVEKAKYYKEIIN